MHCLADGVFNFPLFFIPCASQPATQGQGQGQGQGQDHHACAAVPFIMDKLPTLSNANQLAVMTVMIQEIDAPTV